jgi:hypothetical protein
LLSARRRICTSVEATSHDIEGNFDVAASCFGVRTNLVSFFHQSIGYFGPDARYADVEPGSKEIAGVARVQVYFGVNGKVRRQSDLHFVRDDSDCTLETGRPTGREQLLRIGADARRAGG